MEPNWNRLWPVAQRKICTKQEILDKVTALDANDIDYYFEYVSGDAWNSSTPDEVYFKIKKKTVIE